MKLLKKILANRILSFIIILGLSAASLLIFSSIYFSEDNSININEEAQNLNITGNTSKAILSVNGLSCSSCIEDIKNALQEIDGISDIIVDISNASAMIYYDSTLIKDPNIISNKITSIGYPAEIKDILTTEELAAEEDLKNRKKEFYIIAVDDWEISRSEFDTEIDAAIKQINNKYGEGTISYENNNLLLDNLKIQTITKLVDEAVMLQDISKADYKLEDSKFETEYQNYISENFNDFLEFENNLTDNGYSIEYFKKKFENNFLINEYIENVVFLSASTDIQKQNQFNQWYTTTRSLVSIVYYDKDLEELVINSQAGSSCCPTE